MNTRKRQKATWIDVENYQKIENEACKKGQKIVYVVNLIIRQYFEKGVKK